MNEKHLCHWVGCEVEVPPEMWGCRAHWRKLPAHLRARVWATYRPGQETDKQPSREYIAVALQIQEWIKETHNE